jgi:hypothetical protein
LLVLAALQPIWEIPGLDVRLAVQPDRSIIITELIEVNSGPNELPGVDRELPTRIVHPQVGALPIRVRVRSVTEGSAAPVPYQVVEGPRYLAVHIGHPDSATAGAHIYRLEYEVRGAIVEGMNRESLTWPVVNGEWNAGIFQVEAVVELPWSFDAASLFAASETGYFDLGGRAADVQVADPQRIVFRQLRGLKAHERLRIHASWPRPAPAVTGGDARDSRISSETLGFVLLAIVIVLVLVYRRRAPRAAGGG